MHMVSFFVALIALVTLPLSAQLAPRTPAENDALPSALPTRVISYGERHPSQSVHIRVPDPARFGNGPFPTVVVFHGGCWVQEYATLKNTAALADALRNNGYVTINVEYRRVNEKNGGWPGTFYDAVSVVDNLKSWSNSLAVDMNNIATIGHSAGGHLALWSLARESIAENSPLFFKRRVPLKGAISLGGPADLLNSRETLAKVCGVDAITPLLGGESLRAWNAQSGSPAELLPFSGKQYLFAGDADPIVPAAENEAYKARVEAAGGTLNLVTFKGVGHHDYLNPGDKRIFPAILKALEDIFQPAR